MKLRATVRHLAVAGLALAVVSPALAAGRAFEIADYYRTAFVGSPALSRDGSAVVFSVRRYELEKGESWAEIWMANVDGGNLRQLTFGHHHDSSPTFSADGRQVFFVSDRSGDSQLWVMAVDGGEARQLTRFPTGVDNPVVSPDGRFIAVLSQVYPECGADAECNRTTQKAITGGPLKVHVADELLYRHWTEWRDGRYRHVLLVDAASGEVTADATPGRWDSPTFALGGPPGYAFSPDGRQLCVVSDHAQVPALSTNSDLWLVDIAEDGHPGTPRNITAANPGWDGDPTFSPDGRFIAYRSQAIPGYESALFRLALYDRTAGTVRYLTDRERFDNWVEAVGWGGTKLFFQGAVKGYNPIFSIDTGSGAITQVLVDGTIDAWQATPDGTTLVYARRAVDRTPELARLRIAAGAPERITWFNRELETEVDLRPAEVMWVEGDGGRPVQVFIVTPHGFDPSRRYPLILNVHGGPQMQWTDAYRGDWQVYPGKGYVVAFANPTGSTGNGQEVTDGIACDWGGRVWRDLMKVTDALARLPYVDADRMGAMGWSWGGYAMMWAEGSVQGPGLDDGRLRPALDARWHRGALVPGARPVRDPLDQPGLRAVVAVALGRELRDALPGDHRRAGLPGALHPEPAVLHRPPEDEGALAFGCLPRRGSLAGLVRDGVLLSRPPRLVPPVARRRAGAVAGGKLRAQPGVHDRRRVTAAAVGKEQSWRGSSRHTTFGARTPTRSMRRWRSGSASTTGSCSTRRISAGGPSWWCHGTCARTRRRSRKRSRADCGRAAWP